MINERIHEAFERSGRRCEWTDIVGEFFDKKEIRCSEKHGEPAINYKGRVALIPYHFPDKTCKVFCWKHTIAMDKKIKKKSKPRGKRKDKNQTDMFT